MIEAWIVGGWITLGFALLVAGMTALYGTMEEQAAPKRFAAVVLTTSPLTAVLWPVLVVGALLTAIGWGVFTTARVIRHRSFDF